MRHCRECRPTRGQPRIVLDVKLRPVALVLPLQRGPKLLGVAPHGAEFDAGEFPSAEGFAAVDEKDRPTVVDQNQQGDGQIKRQRQDQGQQGEDDVEDSLGAGQGFGLAQGDDFGAARGLGFWLIPTDGFGLGARRRVVPQNRRTDEGGVGAGNSSGADPQRGDQVGMGVDGGIAGHPQSRSVLANGGDALLGRGPGPSQGFDESGHLGASPGIKEAAGAENRGPPKRTTVRRSERQASGELAADCQRKATPRNAVSAARTNCQRGRW